MLSSRFSGFGIAPFSFTGNTISPLKGLCAAFVALGISAPSHAMASQPKGVCELIQTAEAEKIAEEAEAAKIAAKEKEEQSKGNPTDSAPKTMSKADFVVPTDPLKDYTRHPEYDQFVKDTVAKGVKAADIQAALSQAERKKAILEAISRPAEKRLNWEEYRDLFIVEKRIEQGKAFLKEHREVFDRAEKQYGVPKHIIAGIIGVETWYGNNKGKWRVVDALATLGFDYPPRAPFFREQLQYYLMLAKEQQWEPMAIKGSYAGAMGYPQFIPSSYRDYAVDFNGDGKVDLINDPVDAIGSVGNYLKRFGWDEGAPVVTQAKGPKDEQALELVVNQSLKPHQTVGELAKCGLTSKVKLDKDDEVTARLFKRSDGHEYWLGHNNFYVISRYNRSPLYVMAVYTLGEALKND